MNTYALNSLSLYRVESSKMGWRSERGRKARTRLGRTGGRRGWMRTRMCRIWRSISKRTNVTGDGDARNVVRPHDRGPRSITMDHTTFLSRDRNLKGTPRSHSFKAQYHMMPFRVS